MAGNSACQRLYQARNRNRRRREAAPHAPSPEPARAGCASLAGYDAPDRLEAKALNGELIPVQWKEFTSLNQLMKEKLLFVTCALVCASGFISPPVALCIG